MGQSGPLTLKLSWAYGWITSRHLIKIMKGVIGVTEMMVMLGDLGGYVPSVNDSDPGHLSFPSGLLVVWLAGIFVLICFLLLLLLF